MSAKFNQVACQVLSGVFEGEQFSTNDDGLTFDSEYSKVQIFPVKDLGNYLREIASENSNPVPTFDEIREAQENCRHELIDFAYDDEHPSARYSEFHAIVNLNTGEVL